MSERILFVAANPSIDRLVEVDALVLGTIHRPDVVVTVAGGKGLNAARAAAAVGGRVAVAALIGGAAGRWVEAELERSAIEAQLVQVAAETRTCMSVLDRSTGRLTEVYEPGASIAPSDWVAFEELVGSIAVRGSVSVVAVSGSVPAGTPDDAYARIVRLSRTRGVPVLVDAHGGQLDAALAERPTVVKLNRSEARDATGIAIEDAADAAGAAAALRGLGAGAAVVTMGKLGAVVADATGTWWLTPPAEHGPYAVGAGDAFLGGLAVALAAGQPLQEAAVRGMATAVANTLTAGAGVLEPAAVGRLAEGIERVRA